MQPALERAGMKLSMTWGSVARAVGGRLASGSPEAPFDAFAIDSRGDLRGLAFWALKGETHDAHDFLADTPGRGASGWVVQAGRSLPSPRPAQVLEVPETLKALQDLAAFHRRSMKARLACITGSNGKTTTKQMLAAIAARRGPTCATRGNLNNHFGLPLSLLELAPDHAYGVFELGASRAGEIAELTAIAAPDAGVLTNISAAHIGYFGSLETVFETKAALARDIRGPVAVNADDPWLARLLPELGARAVAYGTGRGARVRLAEEAPARRDAGGQVFTLELDGRAIRIALPVLGRFNRLNAAAAAAGALALGLDAEAVREGLASFESAPLRMELRRHACGAAFMVDAYNANPQSMRDALAAFIEAFPDEEKIAVLGDMKELGGRSAELHRELGEFVLGLPLKEIFLAGAEMKPAAEVLAAAGRLAAWSEDPRKLAGPLKALLGPRRAFFFKASRALALERLAGEL